ncbi:MAG TPA: SMI1/KNR4 family protein [Chthoniobacteraceae bacterium]|nr:SMI1/KNR4 family protein [Chthoniobacteraceae bacterium]
MNIPSLIALVREKKPPLPVPVLLALEEGIGERLPEDYREFLIACNGGSLGGRLWFYKAGSVLPDAAPHHVGGLRPEPPFSLLARLHALHGRIPIDLMWIMDDAFGNAICLGVAGELHGRVYFWDHEKEPAAGAWDGRLDTAVNVRLLAGSFTEFVAGLESRV